MNRHPTSRAAPRMKRAALLVCPNVSRPSARRYCVKLVRRFLAWLVEPVLTTVPPPPQIPSHEALELMGGTLLHVTPPTQRTTYSRELAAVALRMGESIALARRDGLLSVRVKAPANSAEQQELIELLADEGYPATVRTWRGPGGMCLEIRVRPQPSPSTDAPTFQDLKPQWVDVQKGADIRFLGDRKE